MRDYDPTSGRYIQADPLGLVDGASVYAYALQNPGRYTDPTGEFVPILLWFTAGMLIDYALDDGCHTWEDFVWSAALNALPWHKFGVLLKMARGTSKARKVAKATNSAIKPVSLPSDIKTWNQFQTATKGQFVSRADAARGGISTSRPMVFRLVRNAVKLRSHSS